MILKLRSSLRHLLRLSRIQVALHIMQHIQPCHQLRDLVSVIVVEILIADKYVAHNVTTLLVVARPLQCWQQPYICLCMFH